VAYRLNRRLLLRGTRRASRDDAQSRGALVRSIWMNAHNLWFRFRKQFVSKQELRNHTETRWRTLKAEMLKQSKKQKAWSIWNRNGFRNLQWSICDHVVQQLTELLADYGASVRWDAVLFFGFTLCIKLIEALSVSECSTQQTSMLMCTFSGWNICSILDLHTLLWAHPLITATYCPSVCNLCFDTVVHVFFILEPSRYLGTLHEYTIFHSFVFYRVPATLRLVSIVRWNSQ